MEFNRERFLLRLIAAAVAIPLVLYGIGAVSCSVKYLIAGTQGTATCSLLQSNLNKSTETALAILLALLGGGAIAADAANSKRREDDGDRGVPPADRGEQQPAPPDESDPRF